MERIKMFAVVAVVLGTAGTLAVDQRRQMTALETRQRALAAAVALTELTAQAERAARDAPARRPAPPGAQVEPTAPAGAAPTTSSTPEEPSVPTAVPPEPAEYAEGLDGSFAAENVDTAWQRRAREAVTNRLAAHGDRSLRAIECRASMCRLATDDGGTDQAWQQIQHVVGNPGDEVWSGAYFSHVEDGADGQPERVTYLFRHGASLPSL